MAVLTAYRPFDNYAFPVDLIYGDNIIRLPDHNRYEEATRAYDLFGTGFTYAIIDGAWEPVGGIINTYQYQVREAAGWFTTVRLEGLSLDIATVFNQTSMEAIRQILFQGDDTLDGSGGNDVLNGYSGVDTFVGRAGNDVYILDNPGDTVIELTGQGIDTIRSTVSIALPDNVETAVLLGAAAADLTGNSAANALSGSTGNNVLDGGRGADSLSGLAGSDTYFVDSGGDAVTEPVAVGVDEVVTTVTFALPANVENATINVQVGTVDLTGNVASNVLTGNDAANVLDGAGGNDQILGNGGDDILVGGDGNDDLAGGSGVDVLLGGAGADRFRFDTAPDGGNVDRIMDFLPGVDDIELSVAVFAGLGAAGGALAAGVFVRGVAPIALDADDRLLYDTATGQLYYDADAIGAASPELIATLQGAVNLGTTDLLLVN